MAKVISDNLHQMDSLAASLTQTCSHLNQDWHYDDYMPTNQALERTLSRIIKDAQSLIEKAQAIKNHIARR